MSGVQCALSSLHEKTSAIADDLIAYADGEPVDAKLRTALDDLIIDYAEGLLDPRAVLDLEACMRRSLNVARLVADMTAEFRLQVRFSMYYDDLLDPESSAELQRLIESDPEAARLARDMRIGGDLCRVMVQPIPNEMPLPAGDPLVTMQAMLAEGKLPYLGFADVIDWAEGRPADEHKKATFERLISDYIAERLDEHEAKGLEAAMRLSKSMAWLVADHEERQRP
ncbi:MAG: hypothetical protein R3F54_15130 [Alphaproteobacteria bacterium]